MRAKSSASRAGFTSERHAWNLLTDARTHKLLDLTDERVREAICRLFDRYPRVGHQYLRELYCVRVGEWDPAPRFE